ncbi:hypothetical protein AAG906_026171 [Vitis piasezkii]
MARSNEGDWVQNGNMYYFEGCQGKGIELKKTTTYEELFKIVCHILKVDPTEHNLSMKYVFNGNIPSTPIQLRDDEDVKIFIRLNCTDGIAESLNVVLKYAIDLPILQLIEELRNLLQKWFANRKQQALSMTTELTIWADGELRVRYNTLSTYEVEAINSMEYAHMSCYPLCSKYYTVNSLLSLYAESIYPPGHQRDWMIPGDISSRVVLPPKTRRPTGRPRKERIPSGGEGKRRQRCGQCGDYGHNRKLCK